MSSSEFFRYRQFTIDQRHAAMKVGTDCDLLGTLSVGGERILDIGTGTGILSLMLAQRYPQARITAVEIDDRAIIDARTNFASSPFADRIELVHAAFQDYCRSADPLPKFDSVVCNPPYFDRSLECADESRTRARHTSSLPFSDLASGAYSLLADEGYFSVCIPYEVLDDFIAECSFKGFWLQELYKIKSLPDKEPVLYILVHKKGRITHYCEREFCMRNADYSRSEWYLDLMRDFHV